jgi:hypothetical protein
MRATRNICLWAIFSVSCMATLNAHAVTVSYTLDNVFLEDGAQMTGEFDWTYDLEDFEGGEGVFTALVIPYRPAGTLPPLEDENLIINIESNQIEISGDGSFHDYGLDIILKFAGLSPTQSVSIDETTSFYECCGNGFKSQPFQSGGSISPVLSEVPVPAAAWLFGSALLGLAGIKRKRA